mmetsp:Transcript_16520/g.34086  ORF Transcript_16520/g.34086 Transcript_16520/m.34086 type:complete len:80 (+) Transcript_16520:35-274(+)
MQQLAASGSLMLTRRNHAWGKQPPQSTMNDDSSMGRVDDGWLLGRALLGSARMTTSYYYAMDTTTTFLKKVIMKHKHIG